MLNAYSIFDEKAKCFNTPFFAVADGVAIRDFGDLCNDTRSLVSRHPEDYRVYRVGQFNDDSGKFESLNVPEFLANGSDLIRLVQPSNNDNKVVEPVQPGGESGDLNA